MWGIALKMFRPLSVIRTNNLTRIHRLQNRSIFISKAQHVSPKERENEEVEDKPIQYTKSAASKWEARMSRTGPDDDRLWYEPYVILASLTVLLLYFTIIREESDIDQEFSKTLYKRIEGLEEVQLQLSLEYNKEHNLETSDIIKRLEEVQKEKQK